MNELHLFAGAGGGILGGMLLGHTCVCAVEIEPYPRAVLFQRQRDGILPRFPIWDDICTFDGKPWKGKVDIVCGGFPCTEIANCAAVHGKRTGLDGEHSGLWYEMRRVICEVQPSYAFVENSSSLIRFGLDRILTDFYELGYDARWGVLGGHHLGAPHGRARTWIVAHSRCQRMEGQKHSQDIGENRPWGSVSAQDLLTPHSPFDSESFGESMLLRVDDGVADRLDSYKERLKAIGNGQIPIVAAFAWGVLTKGEIVK